MITQIQITLADLQFSAQGFSSSLLILGPGTREIDLSDKGLPWDQVGRVNTRYYDVYRNGYTFKWDK